MRLWYSFGRRGQIGLGFFSSGCGRARFCFSLGFRDRSNHVERAFRIVLEFVAQDSLAAVQCVLQANKLAVESGKLLGRKTRLGQEPL